MNRVYLTLAGMLLAVAASSSTAQTPAPGGTGTVAVDPLAARPDSMREDTAVFQLLLNRSLGRHYGIVISPGTSTASCTGMREAHFPPRAEGVYLKGHGVVYTVGLPATSRSPVAADSPPADKPTEWDRAASELRGEKPATGAKATGSREESLSTSLLRVLAENGKHFRGLPADEQITVAVTFRGTAANCTSCHATGVTGSTMRGGGYQGGFSGGGGFGGGGLQSGGGFQGGVGGGATGMMFGHDNRYAGTVGQQQPPGTGVGASGGGPPQEASSDVQAKVLLGDMLMKQGKATEAVRKYAEALNALSSASDYDKGTAKQRLQQLHTAIDIVNRAARAQLAAGNSDQAEAMLKTAAKLTDKALTLTAEIGLRVPAKQGARVPDQLVVSAPKRLLDQVGTSKISFDEFRKAASVEYFHKGAE